MVLASEHGTSKRWSFGSYKRAYKSHGFHLAKHGFSWPSTDVPVGTFKETILERADFALQLLMFVTAEKERRMFIIFFLSSFCQLLSLSIQARTGWVRSDYESSDHPA